MAGSRAVACDAKEWHLHSQPITAARWVSSDNARRHEGHVPLVEDNPVNHRAVAVRFLKTHGLQGAHRDNGAEGVKAWQEGRFDIVPMDLQMPVMDGLTATRRICELEAGGRSSTPIVALTANVMQ